MSKTLTFTQSNDEATAKLLARHPRFHIELAMQDPRASKLRNVFKQNANGQFEAQAKFSETTVLDFTNSLKILADIKIHYMPSVTLESRETGAGLFEKITIQFKIDTGRRRDFARGVEELMRTYAKNNQMQTGTYNGYYIEGNRAQLERFLCYLESNEFLSAVNDIRHQYDVRTLPQRGEAETSQPSAPAQT